MPYQHTGEYAEGAPGVYTALGGQGGGNGVAGSYLDDMQALQPVHQAHLELGRGVVMPKGLFIITSPRVDLPCGV